ncbi:MAG TPA: phage Gp37/Gp68 family protein [Streptosporangiaceae bacterium]
MSDKTGIEWTRSDDGTAGATWNPVTGCEKVSPGCDHCYAETFAERWRGTPGHYFERGFDVTLRPDKLDQPLRWKRPRRIFVNSMSDLFHKDVPDAYIACVFTVMAKAQQHTFQVLTKRHARMRSLLADDEFQVMCLAAALARGWDLEGAPWPLPNVHLGVSVEDQRWADIRIPALCQTPAAVRFLSCEPLLGPVTIPFDEEVGRCTCGAGPNGYYGMHERGCGTQPGIAWNNIHWVIAGGESGPGARRMDAEWARGLVRQCREWNVPVFVKQLGSVLGRELGAGPKGGDWDAWPEDLRVREFPRAAEAVTAS